jgi:hypothetical protein
MAKRRIRLGKEETALLLFQNRHTCCVCRIPRKPIQIHHIDEDPSNNAPENLAVICLQCHSDVSNDQGFGQRFSMQEVTFFKMNWERKCAEWQDSHLESDEGEDEEEDANEPIDSDYQDSLLREDEYESFNYQLDEGNVIVVGVTSDEPVDLMIMTQRQFKLFDKSETDEGSFIQQFEDIYQKSTTFVAPRDGWYTVGCGINQ